jgi:hypothetical protein
METCPNVGSSFNAQANNWFNCQKSASPQANTTDLGPVFTVLQPLF